ncbi:hypothetical protein D3C72_1833810 [compost metagenome]
MLGQLHLGRHEFLDQVLAHDPVGTQQHGGHHPVQHRGLPLDEGVVVRDEGGAAKDDDDPQADPLHGLDLAGLHAQVGNLRNGGNDGHARCHKHTPYLEGDEEQQDGEKIDQEFHMQGGLEGRSAWRVGVVLVGPQSAAQCFV